jgi:hypothetical protein
MSTVDYAFGSNPPYGLLRLGPLIGSLWIE